MDIQGYIKDEFPDGDIEEFLEARKKTIAANRDVALVELVLDYKEKAIIKAQRSESDLKTFAHVAAGIALICVSSLLGFILPFASLFPEKVSISSIGVLPFGGGGTGSSSRATGKVLSSTKVPPCWSSIGTSVGTGTIMQVYGYYASTPTTSATLPSTESSVIDSRLYVDDTSKTQWKRLDGTSHR